MTIDGGGGSGNRLIVDDSGSSSAEAVVFTNNSITGLSSNTAEIDYAATCGNFTDGGSNDGILLKGGSAVSTYAIQSTLAGSTTKIIAGTAGDTFTVTSASGDRTSVV